MDLTNTVWRECLQQHSQLKQSKKQILKPSNPSTQFQKSCYEVYESIKTFEKFLEDNRSKYLNIGHSLSKANELSERDRDEIDREAQLYISETNQRLNQIRKLLVQTEAHSNANVIAHNQGILYHLADYLEHVSERLTKQRLLRFEQQLAQAALAPEPKTMNIPAIQGESLQVAELELSEDLTRELLKENVVLQKELDDMVDQVREVETQVVAISQAHQILSENLMKQKDNIHQITKHAIDARKSVARGNKELVKASQRGVDFRIFVLLFLLLLSFALLFLHWIQD